MKPPRKICSALALALGLVGGTTPPVAAQAQKAELVVQTGQFLIRAAAYSPDGALLATGSVDGSVKLWDAASGDELRTFRAGDDFVEVLAFSPDNRLLATLTHYDNHVRLWEVATGAKLSHTLPGSRAVAFDPSGQLLATERPGRIPARGQAEIVVWKISSGKEEAAFPAGPREIAALGFSPDGKVLAGAADAITLWSLDTQQKIGTLPGNVFFFLPGGREILTASAKAAPGKLITIVRFAIGSLAQLGSFHAFSHVLYGLASTSENLTAVGCEEEEEAHRTEIRQWELATGRALHLPVAFPGCYHEGAGIALAPDGRSATAGLAFAERVIETSKGNPRFPLTGESSGITSIGFSPDGSSLFSSTFRGDVKIWPLAGGTEIINLRPADPGQSARLTRLAVSPDGRYLAVADAAGEGVVLWSIADRRPLRTLTGGEFGLWTLGFSKDSHTLAVGRVTEPGHGAAGREKNQLELFDVASGASIAKFDGRASADFSPDGNTVAIHGVGVEPLFWNLAMHHAVIGPRGCLGRTIFSPDDTRIACRGTGKEIQIRDAHTGEPLATISPEGPALTFLFSPDGKVLATLSATHGEENPVALWNARTGQRLARLEGYHGDIEGVAFTPNSRFLATGSLDRSIRLWSVADGEEIVTLVAVGEHDWAVVSPQRRFDASPAGRERLVHWTVGTDAIRLGQVRRDYYEPYLLAKLLGFNEEPLSALRTFPAGRLFPRLEANWEDSGHPRRLVVHLMDRGGGIGAVEVFVNGSEFLEDARPTGASPSAGKLAFPVDLYQAPNLQPSRPNKVRVVAWNHEGDLSSRELKFELPGPPAGTASIETKVYAIMVGISAYAARELSLRYPPKDAEDMALALRLAAEKRFGPDAFQPKLLVSGGTGALVPTKTNIRAAFDEVMRQAQPQDILVVSLAGHGVVRLGDRDRYYFLTQEARSSDTESVDTLAGVSIPSDELISWARKVKAVKKVLILDTCGAAGLKAQLFAPRGFIPTAQRRAIDDFSRRRGFWVLMGSAADASSYESALYDHGLLTYALLEGMKEAPLEEQGRVYVSSLINSAENTVPKLARAVGASQQPVVAVGTPDADDFYLGELTPEDRQKIPLTRARTVVARPVLLDQAQASDSLALSDLLDKALGEVSVAQTESRGGIAYLPETNSPDAIQPTGVYSVEGITVKVHLVLQLGKRGRREYIEEGSTKDLPDLIRRLLRDIEQFAATAG